MNISVTPEEATTVPVSFTGNGEQFTLSLTMHVSSSYFLVINGTVNDTFGIITILPESLANVLYGSYEATVVLDGANLNEEEQATIHYEEDITVLTVRVRMFTICLLLF